MGNVPTVEKLLVRSKGRRVALIKAAACKRAIIITAEHTLKDTITAVEDVDG
jgi:hypothetical protein